MKYLVVGDIHLGVNGEDVKYKHYTEAVFKWVQKVGVENNITDMILLGDIFDNRKYLTADALEMYHRFFGMGFNFHILAGNHDILHKNTNEVNWFNSLRSSDYSERMVTIASTEPEEFDNMILVPWFTEKDTDIISTIEKTQAKYMFAHLDMANFKMNKGILSKHSSIDADSLRKFKLVCSGHYHCPSENKNIIYLGSLIEKDWSDCGEQKFIGIFDSETGKLERVRNPHRFYRKIIVTSSEDEILINHNEMTRIIINCAMDKKLNKQLDGLGEVDIVNNYTLLNEMTIIDVDNTGILEIWNEFMDTQDANTEELTEIFEDAYNRALMKGVDDEL